MNQRTVKIFILIAQYSEWMEHRKAAGSYDEKYEDVTDAALAYAMAESPSGSGIDSGIKLVSSSKQKMVFSVPFHHMDQNGYYDGWSEYTVVVKPELSETGFDMLIKGRDRDLTKSYLFDLFYEWLQSEKHVFDSSYYFTPANA